jgi:hypothetical protein
LYENTLRPAVPDRRSLKLNSPQLENIPQSGRAQQSEQTSRYERPVSALEKVCEHSGNEDEKKNENGEAKSLSWKIWGPQGEHTYYCRNQERRSVSKISRALPS